MHHEHSKRLLFIGGLAFFSALLLASYSSVKNTHFFSASLVNPFEGVTGTASSSCEAIGSTGKVKLASGYLSANCGANTELYLNIDGVINMQGIPLNTHVSDIISSGADENHNSCLNIQGAIYSFNGTNWNTGSASCVSESLNITNNVGNDAYILKENALMAWKQSGLKKYLWKDLNNKYFLFEQESPVSSMNWSAKYLKHQMISNVKTDFTVTLPAASNFQIQFGAISSSGAIQAYESFSGEQKASGVTGTNKTIVISLSNEDWTNLNNKSLKPSIWRIVYDSHSSNWVSLQKTVVDVTYGNLETQAAEYYLKTTQRSDNVGTVMTRWITGDIADPEMKARYDAGTVTMEEFARWNYEQNIKVGRDVTYGNFANGQEMMVSTNIAESLQTFTEYYQTRLKAVFANQVNAFSGNENVKAVLALSSGYTVFITNEDVYYGNDTEVGSVGSMVIDLGCASLNATIIDSFGNPMKQSLFPGFIGKIELSHPVYTSLAGTWTSPSSFINIDNASINVTEDANESSVTLNAEVEGVGSKICSFTKTLSFSDQISIGVSEVNVYSHSN